MRYVGLLCLLTLMGCAVLNLPPAGPSNKVMNKANIIIVETSDTPEHSLSNMRDILRNLGYSIKSYNDQQYKLTTNYRRYGDSKIKISTDVVKTDSSSLVELRGIVNVPDYQYRKEYGGAKPSTTTKIKKKYGFNPAWDILQAIAEKYPEGTIWYARKPDKKNAG